jgi:hypothetical protein
MERVWHVLQPVRHVKMHTTAQAAFIRITTYGWNLQLYMS